MRFPSKSRTFAILMVVSAAMLVAPTWMTNWIRLPFQFTGLLQLPFFRVAQTATQAAEEQVGRRLTQAESEELQEQYRRMKARVAQLQLWHRQLEDDLTRATGIQGQLRDKHVVLALVPVIGFDANPQRSTMRVLLSRQTSPLIERGQWVAAGAWTTPTRERLSEEWLVGRVLNVASNVATVLLVNDPRFREAFQEEVRIAQLAPDGLLALSAEALIMDGRGPAGMRISQAQYDYFHAQPPQVMVVAPPSRYLPNPMLVGRVVGSRQRSDSSRHYDLQVEPWGPLNRLTHVFVIVPDAQVSD